jgi:hypothetical protein
VAGLTIDFQNARRDVIGDVIPHVILYGRRAIDVCTDLRENFVRGVADLGIGVAAQRAKR